MFKKICVVVVVVGLAWIYTAMYGGPLSPVFGALDRIVPDHQSAGMNLGF